jgi:uncharacterized protein (TIGR00255 family)
MTAFARSERQTDGWVMTWELRSMNHRYLDSTIRLPEMLRALEPIVRERIHDALSRGKLECNLKLQSGTGVPAELFLNKPVAQRLLRLAAELEELMGPGTGLRPVDVLSWPGVVGEAEPDLEKIQAATIAGLDAALAELIATRQREGERIAQLLSQRCDSMAAQIRQVRLRRPGVVARLREKLLARLADLALEPDTQRLEQEMVIMAQRLDVEEELDRLDAHLAEISNVLQRSEPIGRRLDFLMQELNREANTLSAKSADTETTRAAVELKVLIEQMREQIQNIE